MRGRCCHDSIPCGKLGPDGPSSVHLKIRVDHSSEEGRPPRRGNTFPLNFGLLKRIVNGQRRTILIHVGQVADGSAHASQKEVFGLVAPPMPEGIRDKLLGFLGHQKRGEFFPHNIPK
jgi:hypothetical protein